LAERNSKSKEGQKVLMSALDVIGTVLESDGIGEIEREREGEERREKGKEVLRRSIDVATRGLARTKVVPRMSLAIKMCAPLSHHHSSLFSSLIVLAGRGTVLSD